jgi:hypothetical protein
MLYNLVMINKKLYPYKSITIFTCITIFVLMMLLLDFIFILLGVKNKILLESDTFFLNLSIILYIYFRFQYVICVFFVVLFFIEKKVKKFRAQKNRITDINFTNKKQYKTFFLLIILSLLINIIILYIEPYLISNIAD